MEIPGGGIYIYGTGGTGKYTYNSIAFLENVAGKDPVQISFIDGINPAKQEAGYLGHKVVSLETALKEDREKLLVLIAVAQESRPSVVKKLIAKGLRPGEHFFDYQEFIEFYLPVYTAYHFNKVYLKRISFSLTTKCILRCQNCGAFTPYMKSPTNDPIEDLKKDLALFFSCVDYVGHLGLVGGEVFLHPDLKELIQYIGEDFRKQIACLTITTSGGIMPDDETFQLFKKYGVSLYVSDYREALPRIVGPYNQFVKKLEEFEVDHILASNHDWMDFGVFREDDRLASDVEKISWFDACDVLFGYYKSGKSYSVVLRAMRQKLALYQDVMRIILI